MVFDGPMHRVGLLAFGPAFGLAFGICASAGTAWAQPAPEQPATEQPAITEPVQGADPAPTTEPAPLADAPAPSAETAPSPVTPAPAVAGATPSTTEPEGYTLGIASVGIGTALLGIGAVAWWSDTGFERFHLKDAGYFGKDTYAGGADKIGHLYTCYLGVMLMSSIYEGLGASQDRAAIYATVFTLVIANGVELTDGFSPYGFEYGDAIVNTIGIGLGAAARLYPAVDDVFGMRIGYLPSPPYLKQYKGKSLLKTYLSLVNDYTGQVVYADAKLGGITDKLGVRAGPLRYVLLSGSYGTGGYSPEEGERLHRRNVGVHLGLDVTRLLEDLDLGDGGYYTGRLFKYYAAPIATLGFVRSLDDGQWMFNLGVANRFEAPL